MYFHRLSGKIDYIYVLYIVKMALLVIYGDRDQENTKTLIKIVNNARNSNKKLVLIEFSRNSEPQMLEKDILICSYLTKIPNKMYQEFDYIFIDGAHHFTDLKAFVESLKLKIIVIAGIGYGTDSGQMPEMIDIADTEIRTI
jgi:hypothetical protein